MKKINENHILIEFIKHSLINEALSLELKENLNEGLKDFVQRKAQIAMFLLPALGGQLLNVNTASAQGVSPTTVSDSSYSNLTEHDWEDLDNLMNFVLLKHEDSKAKNASSRYFALAAKKKGYNKKQIQEYLSGWLTSMTVTGKRPANSEVGEDKISLTNRYIGADEAVKKVTDKLMTDEYKEIKNEIGKKFTDYYKRYEDLLMNNSSNDKSLLKIYDLLKHAAKTFDQRKISADQVYCLLIILSGGDAEYESLMKKDLRGLQQAGTSDLEKSSLNKMISFFHNDIKGLKDKDKIKEIKSILNSSAKLSAALNMLAFRKSLTSSSNSGKFLREIEPILNTIVKSDTTNRDRTYRAKTQSPGYKKR